MNNHFKNTILKATGATDLFEIEVIQQLWSGYGQIIRYGLEGATTNSIVVKHVKLPNEHNHPRGWNTNISHNRKLKSYQVETAWYQQWSSLCDNDCKIPNCLAFEAQGDEVLIVLEDLDAAGFPARKHAVGWDEIAACLKWLAYFHATFMGKRPDNLWETGTYWHLDTRPDELQALTDSKLKANASHIDQVLRESPFQTIVHGDAKLANFCFSQDGKHVAAVDFQYVGGGCGMKDVAYFIGSCLNEDECEAMEGKLLDYYFRQLRSAIKAKGININFTDLESNWHEMFPFAWTDFHRFLKGWSPGHWKINSYSEQIAQEVIEKLNA
ncbi:oxidoreductase family protein [Limibacter armeniacum]|uniref:oxidoreductase family protein n=1 Tax=Limibacter armeniacum TaxID=466084 RepID=UPI002FE5D545